MKNKLLVALVLTLLVQGCSGSVETEPMPSDGGGSGVSALPDRLCEKGEEASVTQPNLSLLEHGCEEVVNRSGIPGVRAWCCASGAIPAG